VSGTSSTDVWAVGENLDSGAFIILHWDGASWTPAPFVPTESVLYGVAAVAPDEAWAVGYIDMPAGYEGVVYHWDGTLWAPVDIPNPGGYGILYGMTAISATDVWAVGFWTDARGVAHGLAEHWDGTSWTVTRMPDGSRFSNVMEAVAEVAPDDVWAVGYHIPDAVHSQPLAEHWDGGRWSVVPTGPYPPDSASEFLSVGGVSGTEVWAGGTIGLGTGSLSLLEHWDGISWHRAPVPDGFGAGQLWGIAAISSDDAWVVGLQDKHSIARPASLYWDGTSWIYEPPPHPFNSALYDVVAISPTDLWAVGVYGVESLIMHSAGPCSG
jgi:hypothetical protein